MAKRNVDVNIRTKADTSGLEKTAKSLDRVEKEAKEAESRTNALAGKFRQLARNIPGGNAIRGVFDGISVGAGKAVAGVAALFTAVTGLFSLLKQGISKVSIAEDIEASLTTLLGSAEAAQQRLKEIQTFAAETPLTIAGLATASRQLETLTGGALGAADSLRLVGNAAAIAQRPGESLDMTMQNVALHIGRLNAALKSGKGQIGESIMRLQELGLLAPDLAFELRRLHSEAGNGEKAWGLLEASLKKFDGEMERRSKTISGRASTLADAWGMFTAAVAKPLAPILKGGLSAATGLFNGLTAAVHAVSTTLGIIPKDADAAGDAIKSNAEKAKIAVEDFSAVAEESANSAKAAVEALAAKYEEIEASIGRSVKRSEELRKVQMDLAMQAVEADASLSPIEKERRKGLIRETAGQASREAEIKGLQDVIAAFRAEINEAQKQSFAASTRENELAAKIAELTSRIDQAKSDAARGKDLDAMIGRIQSVVTRADELEAAIANRSPSTPLAKTAMLREKLAGLGDVTTQRQQLARLKEQRAGLQGPSDNLIQSLADAQKEFIAAQAGRQERVTALDEIRAENQKQITALQEQIAHLQELMTLERVRAQGETRANVTREQRNVESSDFKTRAQAAEPISSSAINAIGQTAVELKKAQEGIEQTRRSASAIANSLDGLGGLPSILGEVNRKLNALESEIQRQGAQIKNNRR